MLRVAWLGTYVQTSHDDREDAVGLGTIDLVHDQDLSIGEARVAVDVGLTRRFGASVVVPVRFVKSSIRYLAKSDGSDVELATPGIHHRNETLTGIADPMVLGSFTSTVGALRVVARAGFTVPIGRTEDDPFTTQAMTTPHQHVQMGTGTLNPVLAADVAYSSGKWRVGGFAFTQQVLYESSRGYHAGDRYAAGVTLRRALSPRWSLRGGVEVQGETAERWSGITHTDDGNRGRFDAMAAGGASWLASSSVAIDVALKIPFVTHAVGGQLAMPAILEVGASWSFGGRSAPKAAAVDDPAGHDHAEGEGHDHGDEHAEGEAHAEGEGAAPVDGGAAPTDADGYAKRDPAAKPGATKPDAAKPTKQAAPKLDIANHGAPGDALDLVAIPGKITIYDFWATWCVPCKTLDPALVELARKHPDLVAIRKIDVVDWDSKAAARYLSPGGFDLPHVKIFDPAGTLVFERSSAPGKLQLLIDDVRKLVEITAQQRRAR